MKAEQSNNLPITSSEIGHKQRCVSHCQPLRAHSYPAQDYNIIAYVLVPEQRRSNTSSEPLPEIYLF